MIFGQIISGLIMGSIYSLLGLGFTMIFACTKRINFAHGDLMALGGFIGGFFIRILSSFSYFSLIFGPIIIGFISVVIERLFLRRLQEDQALKIVIATIGLSVSMKSIMQTIWGPNPIVYSIFLSQSSFYLFGVKIATQNLLIFLLSITLMIILQCFFIYSKTGCALRALSQDRYAARLMGIKIGHSISIVYFISGVLAGIAGILVAPIFFISSSMGTFLGLKSFIAAIIGGLGSIPGTIMGGLFLGVVENLSTGFISSNYKSGISLLFLILLLLFSPEGLFSIYKKRILNKRKIVKK